MGFPIAARFAHPGRGYKLAQEQAARHLEEGQVYMVRRLDVGGFDSTLYLDEPGLRDIGFSTVLFEPAVAPSDRDDEPDSPDEEEPPMSTAGDLADYLAAQPRDRKVILRKDAEGSGHSPLAEARESMYVAGTAYSGETYLTPEDLAVVMAGPNPDGWGEDDAAPDGAERVIVLGPVN